MNRASYTAAVLRYVHDPAVGEFLNVGVVLHCADHGFLDGAYEFKYQRLSAAFPSFDGKAYRDAVDLIKHGVAEHAKRLRDDLVSSQTNPSDVGRVLAQVLPDRGLSFQVGPLIPGIAGNPKEALEDLFNRYVASAEPHRKQRRDNKDVWQACESALKKRNLLNELSARDYRLPDAELHFEHTFKNGSVHAIQPLSFDFQDPERMTELAYRWVGQSVALKNDVPDFGSLFVLAGRPSAPEMEAAYRRALAYLKNRLSVDNQVFEEGEVETLAGRVEALLRH